MKERYLWIKKKMIELIEEERINNDNNMCDCDGCKECVEIEICYHKAVEKCNHEFAKSCDYGGCDTEEEFWEQLYK